MSSIWTITNYSDIKISKQRLPDVSKDGNRPLPRSPVVLGLFAWFLRPVACIRQPGWQRSDLHFCFLELLKVAHTSEGAWLSVEFPVYCVYLRRFRYLKRTPCRWRLTTGIMGEYFFSSAWNSVQCSEAFWLDKLWKSFVHSKKRKKDRSYGYLPWTGMIEGAFFTLQQVRFFVPICQSCPSLCLWADVRVLHTTKPSPFSWDQAEFLSHQIFSWEAFIDVWWLDELAL